MSRPEQQLPPELFYGATEAAKYTGNSRIIEIQRSLTERALEILSLPSEGSSLVLDVGCGSGLSCAVVEEQGHYCIGCDISPDMTDLFADIVLRDMGDGLPFRTGVFDGAISISAIQWLCYSNKRGEVASRRLSVFFQSLYQCLKRGARAVFQFYPETTEQIELITACATRCGFTGGLLVDYPNSSKAKKYYLCLFAGQHKAAEMPRALTEESEVGYGRRQASSSKHAPRGKSRVQLKGSRDWVLQKKEHQRQQGKEVRPDTKYTGRRRKFGF